MKIDNDSLAIEIVYAAILESMAVQLREYTGRESTESGLDEFEAVYDDLAESIENLMGVVLRGGAASARLKRIVKQGCFKNRVPLVAVWLFHEAVANETLTSRLLDEIEEAGEEGRWDCVPTRNVMKAQSVLKDVMLLRQEHEDQAMGLAVSRVQPDNESIRIYDTGKLAYAA